MMAIQLVVCGLFYGNVGPIVNFFGLHRVYLVDW